MSELLEKYRYSQVDSTEWYESTKEAFHKALELIGFYDVESYFTGFSSQGDGACFTGRYGYERGGLKALKSEFPTWKEMHELAKELQDLQSTYFYKIEAKIKTSGRYCHSITMGIEMELNVSDGIYMEVEEQLLKLFRKMADLYYKDLEAQFDYLTSDSEVQAWLESNDITE